MVFSSITFLFYFLPSVCLLYWFAGKSWRNILLLAASLLFYAWGEGVYVLLMLLSISMNYCAGRLIHAFRSSFRGRFFFIVSVVLNLSILAFFKYAHFVTDNINLLLGSLQLPLINLAPVHLPIGISFFTFQALSYIIDVYREKITPQENFITLGLYISLFPQLIAGPIVRYHNIAQELLDRAVSTKGLAEGIQRFLFGLSKKVLLANPLAVVADQIFAMPETELTAPLAWLGAICYTLQIYYDFSGYSDMAIGLGRIFGFHFLENFNYPYISRSISEYWRRWHISLSHWLRDYVYIPLGGNRRGYARTQLNLVFVFFLCGLWHGASWNFLVWGLYHGFFVLLERTRIGKIQQKLWVPLQILICLSIIIFGFVLFRCETLSAASHYLSVMLGMHGEITSAQPIIFYLTSKLQLEIFLAILIAMPIYPMICNFRINMVERLAGPGQYIFDLVFNVSQLSLTIGLFYFTCISLAAGVYNPFIYFRF
jgi:alginate O-acetyltransferase complex protein AlgI